MNKNLFWLSLTLLGIALLLFYIEGSKFGSPLIGHAGTILAITSGILFSKSKVLKKLGKKKKRKATDYTSNGGFQ